LSTLAYIIAASLAGGVLSIVAAAGTLALHPSWISKLVSFAVGALLGAVFLELLPHALETGKPETVMITVLIGLLLFFLLEKLVLWRHSHGHGEAGEGAHEHDHATANDHGRSGLMIVVGNSVHNLCDGIVIAVSFLADATLGVATTLAIVSHAIPQQVGDFAVLLHSGYSRSRAFAFNLTTGAGHAGRRARRLFCARRHAADPAERAGSGCREPALRRGGRLDPQPSPATRADPDADPACVDRPRHRRDRRGARASATLRLQ
jgi:zinc and cadmium transporter